MSDIGSKLLLAVLLVVVVLGGLFWWLERLLRKPVAPKQRGCGDDAAGDVPLLPTYGSSDGGDGDGPD
jgi:hypothetical protein